MFYIELEGGGFGPGSGGSKTRIYFNGDYYPYTLSDMGLEAGTYYVTVQALSTLDYASDSKVSSAAEVILTNAEPSGENFNTSRTENWNRPHHDGYAGRKPRCAGKPCGRMHVQPDVRRDRERMISDSVKNH